VKKFSESPSKSFKGIKSNQTPPSEHSTTSLSLISLEKQAPSIDMPGGKLPVKCLVLTLKPSIIDLCPNLIKQ
jgi:hypothetical protein